MDESLTCLLEAIGLADDLVLDWNFEPEEPPTPQPISLEKPITPSISLALPDELPDNPPITPPDINDSDEIPVGVMFELDDDLMTPLDTTPEVFIEEEPPIFNEQPQESIGEAIGKALNDLEGLIGDEKQVEKPPEYETSEQFLIKEMLANEIQVDGLRATKKTPFDFGFDSGSHISIAMDDDWFEEEKPKKKINLFSRRKIK